MPDVLRRPHARAFLGWLERGLYDDGTLGPPAAYGAAAAALEEQRRQHPDDSGGAATVADELRELGRATS